MYDFDMPGNTNVSEELLVEQLIAKTRDSVEPLWTMKNYDAYFEYKQEINLDKTKKLIFRIYHYKTHDKHTMNVYMERKKDNYIPMFVVDDQKLMDLIKEIRMKNKHKEVRL